jgi:hypothetical protein
MSSFGRKIASANRRLSKRRAVVAEATAVTLVETRACLLEDLSPLGARVTGRKLPGLGSQMMLRTDGVEALGRVRWCHGDKRGVVFDEGYPSAGQCLAMQLKTSS